MNKLKIAKDLSLPLETVTQTLAILAKRRAGKSYTMRRMTEQFLEANEQIVTVDPKGDQWGIRSSADGKKSGYPVVIFGGEHGDVPLEVGAGELLAKLVVEERVNVLLDLSQFRKHEVSTFMTAFLENLYRLKAQEKYRTPMMLIIDEADAIAPQKPQKGEERMLGAAEDIVRRGGQRGIGCTLVTQRSAVLNKNVLTQSEILVVLRTIAPQDLAAMKAWIEVHGSIEEEKILMDSLPSLPIGDAWFWSPGFPTPQGIFKRVHVLPIETFDSGATPKSGEKKIIPKNLADVDLEAIKKQMAATIEKIKEDNPKLLKKKIGELERELAVAQKAGQRGPATKIERIEVPTIGKRAFEGFKKTEANVRRMIKEAKALNTINADLIDLMEKCVGQMDTKISKLENKNQTEIKEPKYLIVAGGGAPTLGSPGMPPRIPAYVSDASEIKEMGSGERQILIAAAQYPEGITREHLTVLTGYKRSTRDAYIKRLQDRGFVRVGLGKIQTTDEGIAKLGTDFEPLPTGFELQEHWMRTLPEGEKKILAMLISAYPGLVDREKLTEETGYKRSTRDAYLARLNARRLVVFEGRGMVKAVETLFID